mmetsp:Transcript_17153/g.33612  ORF Transcript_17153/g.33612 Transcript_17153/m.33612 type:complete len:87 (-) Transcript_17153:212-472(-)
MGLPANEDGRSEGFDTAEDDQGWAGAGGIDGAGRGADAGDLKEDEDFVEDDFEDAHQLLSRPCAGLSGLRGGPSRETAARCVDTCT